MIKRFVVLILSFLCAVAFADGFFQDMLCALLITGATYCIGCTIYVTIKVVKSFIRLITRIEWRKLQNLVSFNWRRYGQYAVYLLVFGILIASFFIERDNPINKIVPYANVIIGVFITFLVMRPNFEIGDILASSVNNRLRINVRNNYFLFRLYDISVELEFQRYDEKTQDTITWPIKIVDGGLTILYGKCWGSAKSSQTFHTEKAFVWDDSYPEITCRVKATHSISRLTRVKEKTYRIQDVKPGEYVSGIFTNLSDIYNNDSRTNRQLKAISDFSTAVLPVSLRYSADEFARRGLQDKFELALHEIDKLENANSIFQNILDYHDIFEKLRKDVANDDEQDKGLLQIYKNNKILYADMRERRNTLTSEINMLVMFISNNLEQQLSRKSNNH